ncbi:MAG: hypothetical protein AB8B68_00260 [Rickettsiaceae bacterium]
MKTLHRIYIPTIQSTIQDFQDYQLRLDLDAEAWALVKELAKLQNENKSLKEQITKKGSLLRDEIESPSFYELSPEGQEIIKAFQNYTDSTLARLDLLEDEVEFTMSVLPGLEDDDDILSPYSHGIVRSVSAPAKFHKEFEEREDEILPSLEVLHTSFPSTPTLITRDESVGPSTLERSSSLILEDEALPSFGSLQKTPVPTSTIITNLLEDHTDILERSDSLESLHEIELVGKSRDCCTTVDLCIIL